MNKYKADTTFIQYELWKCCSIGCKFCCNKGQKDINKIDSLNFVLSKLEDPEILNYDEIGFIGGEFFNNELKDNLVCDLFYKVFEKVASLHFNKIYITTSLIFNKDIYLIPFLNYLKELKILNKVLLCTSYDIAFRFKTKEKEELWKKNMEFLRDAYPELRRHVETILTQPFIDAVLDESFSITSFCEKYKTRIDYIEPASGLYYTDKKACSLDIPGFFPTKASFIKFLKKAAVENKEIDLNTFLSMELRSCKLYYIDNGKRLINDDRRSGEGKTKPQDPTKKYEIGFIDSEDKMIDVALKIKELYGM